MPDGSYTPDQASLVAALRSYRLELSASRASGRVGGQRGHGPGSSLELHDFRNYVPGDDLRHVDWRGYARTDQLRVRLHEAEVAPTLEVLVDTSASMALTESKRRAFEQLTAALLGWARQDFATVRLLQLGGGALGEPRQSPADPVPSGWQCVGAVGPVLPIVPLRHGSVRVLVSDCLWPQDPRGFLRRLAAGASRLCVLQLLDTEEREPSAAGTCTLVDVETGERASLQLDAAAIAVYRERLDRLCATISGEVSQLGGSCVPVTAAVLDTMCRRDLVPARVLRPS